MSSIARRIGARVYRALAALAAAGKATHTRVLTAGWPATPATPPR